MKNKSKNQYVLKKRTEELQEYLQFKRRSSVVPAKKGKGAYTRKQKHKEILFEIFK